MKKVYIGGKITGLEHYKELFELGEVWLKDTHKVAVMNPAVLPEGFTHEEYMKICYSMIDVCDTVAFLPNWTDSKGAILEYAYSQKYGKMVIFIPKEVVEVI